MPDNEIVIVGADGAEHVFPAGFDPKRAASIVSHTQDAPHGTAIDPNEPSTYMAGAWKGFKEGVAGGAKGFVQGMAESPGALVSGTKQMLTTNPLTTIKDTAAAIGRIPANVRASAQDPEGWGRDVGNLTGQTMLTMAAPKVPAAVRSTVRVAGKILSPELAARLVKHGTTAIGAVAGGPAGAIVGSEIGAELAARIKTRLTPTKPTGGPSPRLVKGGTPLLSDQLHTILEEIHDEPTGGATAPAAAGSTPDGAQAATSSMRMLAEKPDLAQRFGRTMSQEEASPIYRATDFTKPTIKKVPVDKIVATQTGFQNPIIEQYQAHPGSTRPSGTQLPNGEVMLNEGHHRSLAQMANGATEIEIDVHPMDPALAAKPQARGTWLDDMHARQMEKYGRTTRFTDEGGPPAPIPLSEAMTAVRTAAKEAGVTLRAAEVPELVKVVRTGRSAAQVVDALAIHKALRDTPAFAGLPGEAEVAADLSQRGPLGGRTRQPGKPATAPGGKSPQQLLNEEALARRRTAASGNPFR